MIPIQVRQMSDGEELVIEEGCWFSSGSSESPPGETFFARRRQAISGDDDWSSEGPERTSKDMRVEGGDGHGPEGRLPRPASRRDTAARHTLGGGRREGVADISRLTSQS